MARDAELERLAKAQELAFQRRQEAYEAMQGAWERRSSAREAMNRAYEANQRAYEAMQQAWQHYQSVRQANGPRIDVLNAQQESAYQNMKGSFEAASSAHERRDGASAKSSAEDGHRYKAEAQGYVVERRRLVEEIKSARAPHDATKPTFERTKSELRASKQAHERVKDEHERARAEFQQLKTEAERAKDAFHKRLEQLKKQGKQRQDDKRAIAEKAGVPYRFRDSVWVSKDSDGNVNFYFGGAGKPNGPGHGHYVMNRSGEVTYRREPFDPHGAQNVVRDKSLEERLTQIALDAFHRYRSTINSGLARTALDEYHRDRSSTDKRELQYEDGVVKVAVKSGYHRRTNTVATDIIVVDRSNPDERLHLVLSEHDGSILYKGWHKND